MSRRALLLALALVPSAAWAGPKALPPSPSAYVYNEGVISPAEAVALGERLAAFEGESGHQLVVALFQSLDGESVDDYANRLFRHWKIGSAKGNDGALFAVFLKDHRWRVEVGYGLEPVLTDLEAAEIARTGVPYFQSGENGRAVSVVVDGLMRRLVGSAPGPRPAGRKYTRDELEWLLLGAILPGLLFVLVFLLLKRQQEPVSSRSLGARYGAGDALLDFLTVLLRILLLGGGGGGSSGGSYGGGGGGFSGGGGSSGGGGASGGW